MRKFKVTLEIMLDSEETENSAEQYMERKFGEDLKYVEAEYMECDDYNVPKHTSPELLASQRIMDDFYRAVGSMFGEAKQ